MTSWKSGNTVVSDILAPQTHPLLPVMSVLPLYLLLQIFLLLAKLLEPSQLQHEKMGSVQWAYTEKTKWMILMHHQSGGEYPLRNGDAEYRVGMIQHR